MKQIIFTALMGILTLSCNKTIEINKTFDFDLHMLPVITEVEADKPVEMRFMISPIGGEYIHTKYYARFFLYSGKGILVNEDGEAFFPNDNYLLRDKKFRLYYTPSQGSSHQLEIIFFDNFGHEKIRQIVFTVQETEVQ